MRLKERERERKIWKGKERRSSEARREKQRRE